MDKQRINYLLQKYTQGTIDDFEKKELMGSYHEISFQDTEYPDDRAAVSERILRRLHNEIADDKPNTHAKLWRISAAALAFILLSAGVYVLKRPKIEEQAFVKPVIKKQTILPGANVAMLTLGNGKIISLNAVSKGKLAMQGNTVITKNTDGQISYQVINDRKNDITKEPITYNTLTTPPGGQFKITLPDGSNVWLNAASSIKYPSRFNGNERHVELHGEAYFEIFKNKNIPFTVTAENIAIKVLGTHFNVMAYKNEPAINTTLLEGSVSLSAKNSHALLSPGEQAVLSMGAEKIQVSNVNVDDAVAWKNGYFSFRKTNIRTAMNKIARWYNVDVEYRGNVNNKVLGGTVSRAENITELLNYLELTGIAKFKIDGRRIVVICN
ncbi:FecR family protein [Mucilaginibacter sp.]|uniref:FecR family protein n=1 Tax=Mucilaginibacter sp. TaxID=1882438 RepID=UPI0026149DF8|nr:FecR family protein [Mucilaginibacter sp.]MDB5126853.1 FecR family protein [Mucilaginibacter sp.]